MELKQGRFPANNNLEQMETRLIKRIVSQDKRDHPKDVSEVLDVIDYQIKTRGRPGISKFFVSHEDC